MAEDASKPRLLSQVRTSWNEIEMFQTLVSSNIIKLVLKFLKISPLNVLFVAFGVCVYASHRHMIPVKPYRTPPFSHRNFVVWNLVFSVYNFLFLFSWGSGIWCICIFFYLWGQSCGIDDFLPPCTVVLAQKLHGCRDFRCLFCKGSRKKKLILVARLLWGGGKGPATKEKITFFIYIYIF